MKKIYFVFFVIVILLFFWSAIFLGERIFYYDMALVLHTYLDFCGKQIRNLLLPAWNPFQFCGMPQIAFQSAVFYPPMLLGHLFFDAADLYTYIVIFSFFLNLVFTFLFIKQLNVSDFAAIFGAVAYTFSGFMTAHHFNFAIIASRAWTPFILYCYLKFFNTNFNFKFIIFAGFAVALQLLAGHPQPIFTTFIFLSVFSALRIICEASKKTNLKNSIKFLAIVYILGAGLSAFQLLETLKYSAVTSRAAETSSSEKYSYMVMRSMPLYNILNLVYPDFAGNIMDNSYFGEEGIDEFTIYCGIITIFLALISIKFLFRQNNYVKIFTITTLIFLILGLGGNTPLFRILYYVPGFKTFRAPSRFLLFFILSLSVLAAFGIDELLKFKSQNQKIKFKILKFLNIALIIVFLLHTALFNVFKTQIFSIVDNFVKTNINNTSPQKSLLFAKFIKAPQRVDSEFYSNKLQRLVNTYQKTSIHFLIFSVLIYILIFQNSIIKTNKILLAALLVVLLLYELLYFARRNMPMIEKNFFNKIPETAQYLKTVDNPEFFRVYTWNRGRMYYDLKNAQGLNYDKTPYFTLSEYMSEGRSSLYNIRGLWGYDALIYKRLVDYRNAIHKGAYNLLKIASVKYLITDAEINNLNDKSAAPIILNNKVYIYKISDALPLIHFVSNIQYADENNILEILSSDNFDCHKTVVLEEKIDISEFAETAENISFKIITNNYNKLKLEVHNPYNKPALMIYNDSYYDEWRALNNNQPAKIYRANYLFKALIINPGINKIELYYSFSALKKGTAISIVFLIIVFLIIIFRKFNTEKYNKIQ